MRVIGLDPGTEITGYAVVEGTEIIEAGVLRQKKHHDLPRRLAGLLDDMRELIDRTKPELAGVESPFINPKFASAVIPLSHARGVIVAMLARSGVTVLSIAPSEVKKAVGAKGNAKKDTVALFVKDVYSLKAPVGPDCSDALAVAHAASSRAPKPPEPSAEPRPASPRRRAPAARRPS